MQHLRSRNIKFSLFSSLFRQHSFYLKNVNLLPELRITEGVRSLRPEAARELKGNLEVEFH